MLPVFCRYFLVFGASNELLSRPTMHFVLPHFPHVVGYVIYQRDEARSDVAQELIIGEDEGWPSDVEGKDLRSVVRNIRYCYAVYAFIPVSQ